MHSSWSARGIVLASQSSTCAGVKGGCVHHGHVGDSDSDSDDDDDYYYCYYYSDYSDYSDSDSDDDDRVSNGTPKQGHRSALRPRLLRSERRRPAPGSGRLLCHSHSSVQNDHYCN